MSATPTTRESITASVGIISFLLMIFFAAFFGLALLGGLIRLSLIAFDGLVNVLTASAGLIATTAQAFF